MKAVLSRAAGGPETLVVEEVPEPRLGPDQIIVAVKAIGVNFPDLLIIEDKYQFRPERPFSPGAEIAGVVEAVGENVGTIRKGDRVLAMLGWGGMAEKVAVKADDAFVIPDSMPFGEAAAFLMTYGTSYHALEDRARLKPGETLLVLGAAGGVGLASVELGRTMGARVIAAASSREKLDVALAAGAANGIVYGTGPLDRDGQKALAESIKSACGPDGPNVIYDAVGGDYSEPALRSIAWEGRFLVIGFPAGIARLPLNLPLLKGCDIRGIFWGAAIKRDPARHREATAELMRLYAAGSIKPHIHGRFPLNQVAAALQALASRKVTGKVIINVELDS